MPPKEILKMLLFFFFLTTTSKSEPLSEQVHIAFNDLNKLSVSWITREPYANNSKPILYLSQDENMNNSTKFEGYTIINEKRSRYYHHVITSALPIDATYYYKCDANSSIYTFTLSSRDRTTDEKDKSFNVITYGDMGVSNVNNTLNLLNKILSNTDDAINFITHIGDISYADDRDLIGPNPDYIPIWDEWGSNLEPIFSKIPYMTLPGNHETTCHTWSDFDCEEDLRNFSTYRNYFRMPLSSDNDAANLSYINGGPENMWYSFDYKNAHFLMLNTESDYFRSPCDAKYHRDIVVPKAGGFGDQKDFIIDDLKSANSNKNISWIIVMGHRPMYTSAHNYDHPDWPFFSSYHFRKEFEPIFHQYHVDLYISGHVHAYERIYPIYDNNITSYNYTKAGATIHLVTGAAGCIEGHEHYDAKTIHNYTAYYDEVNWGVSKLSIVNDTHINWQFIHSDDGYVGDEIWVVKDYSW